MSEQGKWSEEHKESKVELASSWKVECSADHEVSVDVFANDLCVILNKCNSPAG